MSITVSRWDDKKLKLGWTIKLKSGKLAVITDVFHNGYKCKVIETILDAKPKLPEQATS